MSGKDKEAARADYLARRAAADQAMSAGWNTASWNDRPPLAEPSSVGAMLIASRREEQAAKDKLGVLVAALEECLDWFENRQDADFDGEDFIPNEEMTMARVCSEAIKAVS